MNLHIYMYYGSKNKRNEDKLVWSFFKKWIGYNKFGVQLRDAPWPQALTVRSYGEIRIAVILSEQTGRFGPRSSTFLL